MIALECFDRASPCHAGLERHQAIVIDKGANVNSGVSVASEGPFSSLPISSVSLHNLTRLDGLHDDDGIQSLESGQRQN